MRSFLSSSDKEGLILQTIDLPQERVYAFIATQEQKLCKHWVVKITDFVSFSEIERFILSSNSGRKLLVQSIIDFSLALEDIFERLYLSCIDQEWLLCLEYLEQEEANQIAKKLLMEFLSPVQLQELNRMDGFSLVVGKEKFFLSKRGYFSFDEKDHPKWGFCIHPKDWLPIYDQMLTIKFLLENDLSAFYAISNKRELSFREKLDIMFSQY